MIEEREDDSDIYEGENGSFHEYDFHNDMTEEYVEVEEFEQSVNTSSIPPSVAIEEAAAEEESSREIRKKQNFKVKNYKQAEAGHPRNQDLDLQDYLPKTSTTDNYSKVPMSSDNFPGYFHDMSSIRKSHNNFDIHHPAKDGKTFSLNSIFN